MAMKPPGGPRSASTRCPSLSSCGEDRATRSFSRNLEFDVRASLAAMALVDVDAPDLDSIVLLDVDDGGLTHTAIEQIAVGALWRAGQDRRRRGVTAVARAGAPRWPPRRGTRRIL